MALSLGPPASGLLLEGIYRLALVKVHLKTSLAQPDKSGHGLSLRPPASGLLLEGIYRLALVKYT